VLRTRLIERGLVSPAGTGLVDDAIAGHRARVRIALHQDSSAANTTADVWS
jgi:hypothetical protein